MKLQSLFELANFLRARAAAANRDPNPRVAVGYTAAYALYVHEAVGMVLKGKPRPSPHKGRYWDPQGIAQAKFLEYPARLRQPQIAAIVREAYRKGKSLAQSLLLGGLFLQRESQKYVPVDSGNLKRSAFTRLE